MMPTIRIAFLAAAALSLALPLRAQAATVLSSLGPHSIGLIQDGTSNTLQLGEGVGASFCFDGVATPGGITDGTSNTILFGEFGGLSVVPASILGRAPIGQIVEGSSNTIMLPEASSFCLADTAIGDPVAPGAIADGTSNTIQFGKGSRFDVCLRDVRVDITDGSSNTIQLGEIVPQQCYEDVRLAGDLTVTTPVAVTEPPALAALALGFAALLRRRGGGGKDRRK
jgi:hypothetical protein